MLQNITLDHLKGKTIKEIQITEDSESGGEHSSEKFSYYRKCRGANIEFDDGTVVNFSGYGRDSDIHYWANVKGMASPRTTPKLIRRLPRRRHLRLVVLLYSFVKCCSCEAANKAIKSGYRQIWRCDETDGGFRYILSKDKLPIILFDIFGLRHRINEFLLKNAIINYKAVRPYSEN